MTNKRPSSENIPNEHWMGLTAEAHTAPDLQTRLAARAELETMNPPTPESLGGTALHGAERPNPSIANLA